MSGFDAGDFYFTPSGKRALHRLAGSVAVRVAEGADEAAVLRALTSPGAPLAGCAVDCKPGERIVLLKAGENRRKDLSEPGKFREALAGVRRVAGVRSAHPVFVDPPSQLWLVPTEQIILCLRPGTVAQQYFGAEWARARPLAGTTDQFVLSLTALTAEEMLAEVNRRAADPRVSWAQPNFLGQVIKHTADPFFTKQWALHNTGQGSGKPNADVNAPEAWKFTTGRADVVIALLDDGVQLDHPDLAANIFSNPGETNDGADNDNNGYVDDLYGWNFVEDSNDPGPADADDNHGTATAGLAGAVANNDTGVAGLAYGCRIMPIKVIRGDLGASDVALAESIYYAAGRTRDGAGRWRGADVLSISLSFPESQVVDAALTWAASNGRGGKGCPIFASSGNSASRWLPTRIQVPVGAVLGSGVYSFGFEYCRDDVQSEGENLVKIDNVALLQGDGFTVLNSRLGPNGRQDFEGAFPPAGWVTASSTNGGVEWSATTAGPLTGTGGKRSARSGFIPNNSWTQLITPMVPLRGTEFLSFSCYVSSEASGADFAGDGLYIWVYDETASIVHRFTGPPLPDLDLDTPIVSGNAPIITPLEYPASHPDTIAVGAATDTDRRADYSQYGAGLDFLAPSSGGWSDVVATDRTESDGFADGSDGLSADYFLNFGGTSSAAPLAAAVGALLLSGNPFLTSADIRALLRNTCDKVGDVPYTNGRNDFYGYGRINAQRALSQALPDLLVRVVDFPDPVALTSNLFYTVIVSNRTFATAVSVTLTDALPANVSFLSSAPGGTYSAADNTVVFALGDLAGGSVTQATLLVSPQTSGNMTNTAQAGSAGIDAEPANNRAMIVTRLGATDTVRPTVAIAMPKANARLTNSAVAILGSAGDNAGVAAVEYRLENRGGIGAYATISNQTATATINWTTPPLDLFPGTNTVRVRARDASGNVSAEAARSFVFVARSPLTALTNGLGVITPNLNGQLLEVGKGYVLTATPGSGHLFSNWTGGVIASAARLSFLMQSNLVLQANFVPNPFRAVKGVYNGLFLETSQARHDSSGFFTLTLGEKGGYSGQLQLAGKRHSFTASFDLEGHAINVVKRPGTNSLIMELALDLSLGTDRIMGRVMETNLAWEAELQADRAVFHAKTNSAAFAGAYTLNITGPMSGDVEAGNGVGTVTVDAGGVIHFSGSLADDTKATQRVPVSKYGDWPFYLSLYGGKGSALGWLAFTNATEDSLVGRLNWTKPSLPAALYYRGGFTNEVLVYGSTYSTSALTNHLAQFTTGLVIFSGSPSLTNALTLTSRYRFTGAGPLALTLDLRSGLWNGTWAEPGTGKTLPFKCTLLQQRGYAGWGYVLYSNQSAAVFFAVP